MKATPWVLQNSRDLIRRLYSQQFSNNIFMAKADIKSMVPNLQIGRSIHFIKKCLKFFSKYDDKTINTICFFLKIILKNLIVTYKNEYFLQISGTPMGTNCALAFANITMFMLEYIVVYSLLESGNLEFYARYVDDSILFLENKIRFPLCY